MSNDGTSYKPWKVRKGIFKSTGTSDYTPRNTPSPIIEMPLSPTPANSSSPCSPLLPMSPRVTVTESPLSPPIIRATPPRNVREIPIERFDEVSEMDSKIWMPRSNYKFKIAFRKGYVWRRFVWVTQQLASGDFIISFRSLISPQNEKNFLLSVLLSRRPLTYVRLSLTQLMTQINQKKFFLSNFLICRKLAHWKPGSSSRTTQIISKHRVLRFSMNSSALSSEK